MIQYRRRHGRPERRIGGSTTERHRRLKWDEDNRDNRLEIGDLLWGPAVGAVAGALLALLVPSLHRKLKSKLAGGRP